MLDVHILRRSVLFPRSGVRKEQVASVPEPVDQVEDEKEDGHGDEEEPVHIDVILPAYVSRLPTETALHSAASPVAPKI